MKPLKPLFLALALALLGAICAVAVSVIVFANTYRMNYEVNLLALALVVLVWIPFVVLCYQVKDEWNYYCWRELQKQKRRRRYQ